jgi:DNA-binding NarL/FixJ family response regulator
VLILTTFGLDRSVYESLRAGASGFMLKDAQSDEIAGAVRIVASGEALLAPAVARSVIEEFARHPVPIPTQPPVAVLALTPREREVLDLLVSGLSATTNDLPAYRIEEVYGEVTGLTVRARNIGVPSLVRP